MRTPSLLLTLFLIFPAIACDGGPDPSDTCHQIVDTLCRRSLACLPLEELAQRGIPPDQQSCVNLMSARNGCDLLTETNTCAAGELYDSEAAAACVDDLAAISCTEIVNSDAAELQTGSCAQVCQAPGADQLGMPCDVGDQDFCGAGNKCGFVLQNPDTGFGTYQCVPDGDRVEGAACAEPWEFGDHDDCARGLVCWEEACHALCDGPYGCQADQRCVVNDAEVSVCADTCSVATQDCPPTQGCYPWTNSYAVCLSEGYGFYCDRHDDCAAGSLCVEQTSGDSTCAPTCDAYLYANQWAPGCQSYQVCSELVDIGAVFAGVGVCVDGY